MPGKSEAAPFYTWKLMLAALLRMISLAEKKELLACSVPAALVTVAAI